MKSTPRSKLLYKSLYAILPGCFMLWVRRRYRRFRRHVEAMDGIIQDELRLLAWEIKHGEPFAWEDDNG